ncbi:DNA-binding protein [Cupriavidus sp. USMAA2-4]|uniref:DNA-binding protein n=1 Tax=Cupriavidus sp. USMAA2-4 TaxID=876364 RepID=UPI0018DB89BC|nr:DNA-binding protein [Cupriavidus sp. USMAA2-4]
MTTSIAVAGELFVERKHFVPQIPKHTRSTKIEPATSSTTSTLDVVQSDYPSDDSDVGFLPTKVMKAIALTYESSYLTHLHITVRQVLATLVRFSLNIERPEQLSFVKKATIAHRLNISEATVYRSLTTLEEEGLILREKQKRTRMKLEVIGRIQFTSKLLHVIGIQQALPAHVVHSQPAASRIPSTPARECDPLITRHSEGEDTAGKSNSYGQAVAPVRDVNHGKPQSSLKKQPAEPAAFRRIEGKAVPSDLAWLVEDRSLSLPGLFGLMKRARKASTRLSDVVLTAQQAIAQLRGRDLFAYLAALINKPVDFAFVANAARAERAQRQAEEGAQAEQRMRITTLAASLRGRVIADSDGGSWCVDEASVTVRRGAGRAAVTSAWPLHVALPQLEFLAQLVAGRTASAPGSPSQVTPRTLRGAIGDHLERARALVGARRPSMASDIY